jgi:hypothetical protein
MGVQWRWSMTSKWVIRLAAFELVASIFLAWWAISQQTIIYSW